MAVNADTQEAVAVKIINLEKNPAAAEAVRKEVSQSEIKESIYMCVIPKGKCILKSRLKEGIM